jgi:hypothetical protein
MRSATRLLALAPLTLAMALAARPARADTRDNWVWLNVTAQGPVSGKILAWAEVQGRFGDDASRLSQSILRPGIGYQLSPRVSLWVGYGRITGHNRGKDVGENRLWQQLSWNAGEVAGGALTTRTRLEQRFVNTGSDTGWRLRQLVKFNRPLRKGGDTSFVLTSETFIALDDADWGARSGFDQTRNFAGIGFTVAPKTRLEVGYLNQYINQAGANDRMNHIGSASLLARF